MTEKIKERGRKPKPTAVKVLEGNPGKRSLNTAEPKPEKKLVYVGIRWYVIYPERLQQIHKYILLQSVTV